MALSSARQGCFDNLRTPASPRRNAGAEDGDIARPTTGRRPSCWEPADRGARPRPFLGPAVAGDARLRRCL